MLSTIFSQELTIAITTCNFFLKLCRGFQLDLLSLSVSRLFWLKVLEMQGFLPAAQWLGLTLVWVVVLVQTLTVFAFLDVDIKFCTVARMKIK